MSDINPETIQRLLDLELPRNDSGACTVRGYLAALLMELWREEEGFSGKRPFGNSSWQHDIYGPMARAGFVDGDEDGIAYRARGAADELIYAAIEAMCAAPVAAQADAVLAAAHTYTAGCAGHHPVGEPCPDTAADGAS